MGLLKGTETLTKKENWWTVWCDDCMYSTTLYARSFSLVQRSAIRAGYTVTPTQKHYCWECAKKRGYYVPGTP